MVSKEREHLLSFPSQKDLRTTTRFIHNIITKLIDFSNTDQRLISLSIRKRT
jgi:hypothetical protein